MTSRTRRRVLTCLIAGHLVAGIVPAVLSEGLSHNRTTIALLGVVFSGGGLLGLWAGTASLPVPARLAGLVAGLLYLGCLLGLSEGHAEPDAMTFFFLLAGFSACPGFLGGMVLGRFGPKLRISLVDAKHTVDARVQITVRFLFGLTAAFALFLTALRILGQLNDDLHTPMVLCLALGSTSWLAAAAVLIPRRPLLPALAAIGTSSLAGFIPTHFLDYYEPKHLPRLIALALSQAVITVAFLFVVRWCGYRLAPSKPPPEADERSNPAAGFEPDSAAGQSELGVLDGSPTL